MVNLVEFLQRDVAVLQGTSETGLRRLAEGAHRQTYESNEAIVHQGEAMIHFAVVLSGRIAVSVPSKNGAPRPLARLVAGDTFGETALLTEKPMSVNLIAEEPSELLLVPKSLFRQVLAVEPALTTSVARVMSERMKRLSARLEVAGEPDGIDLHSERQEKILVINCGSSSLKFGFYDTHDETREAHGLIERIGLTGTRLSFRGAQGEINRELPQGGFPEALSAMATQLTDLHSGAVGALNEITVVAHRVVHGGERFTESALITDEAIAQIEALNPLAPLHNPVNLAGIREARRLLPGCPQVAVFDTSFHHTLPAYAYLYGLPYEWYEKRGVRRYGFHGASHQYVSRRAAQRLQRPLHSLRIISCHLGNGASICAIDHGRSVDTSMGFTPLEGLVMGTRSGDVDPGVIAYLERAEKLTAAQSEEALNRRSGLLGLSGVSSDMREVFRAAEQGNQRALLAVKVFCYRLRKYLGAYVAALGGVDAVIFTGGIGQGSAEVRALSAQGLACMGIQIDDELNRSARGFQEVCLISPPDSRAAVLVVPTDEERMMAGEALRTLARSYVGPTLEAQKTQPFLIEVSAHHVHLSQEHVEALFGPGHQLTQHAELSQPGQFACKEQVALVGPKGRIDRVRVLGPTRSHTQVEIAMTEQFKLGVHPPIRESGDIADTPGCLLEGPAGEVRLERGVICALRHIHMTPADAFRYGVRDQSFVRVRVSGDRELVFGDVLVRVSPNFSLAMHIDTDEANAANIQTGARGYIEGIQAEE